MDLNCGGSRDPHLTVFNALNFNSSRTRAVIKLLPLPLFKSPSSMQANFLLKQNDSRDGRLSATYNQHLSFSLEKDINL